MTRENEIALSSMTPPRNDEPPPFMLPRVGIIYPTYNGPDSYRDITRCFETLAKMDYPLDAVEIICVENPSLHGESISFIERDWLLRVGKDFPKLTLHKNKKDIGYSGANNVGLQIAIEHGCDYVFLLNQDADVDPAFLTKAVERAQSDANIMFVQSLILLGQDKNRVNSMGNRITFLGHGFAYGNGWSKDKADTYLAQDKKQNPDLEIPYFSGAAVLVRVDMAKKIGLFDTPFYMYHEDVDASFNARMHGFKTVIEPSSIVYHYYAFSRSIKKFYWMERNRFIVLLTYYKLGSLLLIAIPFLVVEMASLLFAFRGGWWREKLRSWSFFFQPKTWQWIAMRRQRIQKERVVSDREFLKWVSSEILFQESGHEGDGAETIKKDAGGFIMTHIANPGLSFLWRIIYFCIIW